MATRAYVTLRDHTNELSTVSWHVQDITALNFLAITQNLDELRGTIEALSLGTVAAVGFSRTFADNGITVDAPTNTFAQRETKWLVTMRDQKRFLDLLNTIANPGFGKVFSIEIPTADLSLLGNGTEFLNLSANQTAVNSIEANLKSQSNAEAPAGVGDVNYVKVISIQHVARNL